MSISAAPETQSLKSGWFSRSIGPLALLLVSAALLATLPQSPGAYIADARFEHYWGSVQFLERHQWLWDGFRTLGRPTQYFSPVIGTWLALLDLVGAPPWLAERLTHAAYLSFGGIGSVQVLRVFRPRIGIEHVITGLVFMFSPYTTQFLLPSGIFLHYSLSPWLLWTFLRGVRGVGRSSWQWPAAFALLVFIVGALNSASLLYALVPLPVACAYLLWVERSTTWRLVIGWTVRAGVLTAGVSAAAVVVIGANAELVRQNLSSTEQAATVSRASSWTESFRGLGSWLSYFWTGAAPLKSEAARFFTEPATIVASFLLPVCSLFGFARSRWQPRLLFGWLGIVSLVLMVGIHPVDSSPPLGSALDRASDSFVFLKSLRNGYKAGAGLALFVGVMLGTGVAAAVRGPLAGSTLAKRTGRVLAMTGVVLVVLVSSSPFWTGSLYSARDRMDDVPAYWDEAIDWLDARSEDGRVLIAPGANRARYRWGYPGDDIFDALLERDHTARWSLAQGTPLTADLLVAIDEALSHGEYSEGTLEPILERLGIRWLVIRNDLDWQALGSPRPASLDALRSDPALTRVATFGRPGENVTRDDDAVADLLNESDLPPVEVFEAAGATMGPRVSPPTGHLLVDGAGDAWPTLAQAGYLGDRSVVYPASVAEADLVDLGGAAGSVVITDTNRRRVTRATSARNLISHTLAVDEELGRPAGDLFGVEGTQSVVVYPDAETIEASWYGGTLQPFQWWLRPASAFDQDPETHWSVGRWTEATGNWLEVQFGEPRELSTLRLEQAALDGSHRSITGVKLLLDDSEITAKLTGPVTELALPVGVTTTSLRIVIDEVEGPGLGPVGFSEIEIDDLDLREFIRVPTYTTGRIAESDPDSSPLGDVPLAFLFKRATRGEPDEEVALRREFEVPADATYQVRGELRPGSSVDDTGLALLREGAVVGSATSTSGTALATGGSLAVDGDASTAWLAPPEAGSALDVRFPERSVSEVVVVPATAEAVGRPGLSVLTSVSVTVFGPEGSHTVDSDVPTSCVVIPESRDCVEVAIVSIPVQSADRLQVEITGVDRRSGTLGSLPVGITEVLVDGAPVAQGDSQDLTDECFPLLEVDGDPVLVRLTDPSGELVAGEALGFMGCEQLDLESGSHRLVSVSSARGLVDWVVLETDEPEPGEMAAAVSQFARGPSSSSGLLQAPVGGFLISGESFSESWGVRGWDAGTPMPVDTMSAWPIPAGFSGQVQVNHRAQILYQVALVVSAVSVVVCVALVLRIGRKR